MLAKIAEITLPIFVISLVGFFYGRRVKPDLAGANKLVVDVALPVLIFSSLSGKSFNLASATLFGFAAVLLILSCGAMAFLLARFSGAPWRAFLPCVMFTNVGPVGIPLIVLAYGPDGLAPAVILLVLSNLLHFTLGAGLMSGRVDWRMVYGNPLVWATVLGIACSQAHWSAPSWLSTPLAMIGNVLVPMMLLSLGVRLSASKISDVTVGIIATVMAVSVRLLAAYLVLFFVPLEGLERGALILFACLPSAVFNFMLADRFQCAPNQVASIVILSHVMSLAFLPLAIWFAFQ